ncbi:hypothetical protein ZIOFF_065049 [Zingiber officinale]|uniref:Ycf20-like protein n=1 Tax=Zingiber officinale TaxID=94328 RepID=A0A8J5EWN5_ZINOF|nr:hypothetical protein ZIOFF_065049 [Zingiber officinale]
MQNSQMDFKPASIVFYFFLYLLQAILSLPSRRCSFFTCYTLWFRPYHSGCPCSLFPSSGHSRAGHHMVIQENEGPRRLVDIIRLVPDISRNYFKSRPRRALFGGISLLGGFYVAQTISLSFGALGVNDVIAAVVCVLLTEFVTRFYYSRPRVTFPVALLNNFKMGFTYGLFIDAFKLAS